jgi:hypothetical protein
MQKIKEIKPIFLFIGLFCVLILAFFYNKLFFSGISVGTSTPPPCAAGRRSVDLPIPLKAQQADMWCWAASIEMVVNYLKPSSRTSQCQIATERVFLYNRGLPALTSACICALNTRAKCILYNKCQTGDCCQFFQPLSNEPQVEQDTMTAIFEKYGLITVEIPDSTLQTLNTIKAYLCDGKPVVALLKNKGYGQHIVVVKGYQEIDDFTILLMNNPLNNIHADCESCLFVMKVNAGGSNMNSNIDDSARRLIASGTYVALRYFAVIPTIKPLGK